jgi:hypothetical protein
MRRGPRFRPQVSRDHFGDTALINSKPRRDVVMSVATLHHSFYKLSVVKRQTTAAFRCTRHRPFSQSASPRTVYRSFPFTGKALGADALVVPCSPQNKHAGETVMARPIPYLFCRYQLIADGSALSAAEEFDLLKKMRGQRIAHRIRDAQPDDADTYLVKPREKLIAGRRVHTWEIAQDRKTRERTKYDQVKDETTDETVRTDEIRHTKFLAVPSLSALAVDDRISERSLGARSAVSRFVGIVEKIGKIEANITFAGTSQDVQRALDTWTLDQFSFTVRPFNPTPSKPGDKMHELLAKDNVGVMRAVTFPDTEHNMRDSHHGIISEAKGLSDAGYGQIGASGTTPSGLKATINKPKFETDREKNKQHQAQNRTMKVYIDAAESTDDEERALVKALIDLYGRTTETT